MTALFEQLQPGAAERADQLVRAAEAMSRGEHDDFAAVVALRVLEADEEAPRSVLSQTGRDLVGGRRAERGEDARLPLGWTAIISSNFGSWQGAHRTRPPHDELLSESHVLRDESEACERDRA